MPGLAAAAATPARRLTTLTVPVRVTAWRVLLAGELGDAESKDISKLVRSCEPAPPHGHLPLRACYPPSPQQQPHAHAHVTAPPGPPSSIRMLPAPLPRPPMCNPQKAPPPWERTAASPTRAHRTTLAHRTKNPGAPHKKLYNFIFNFILIFTKCCLPALLQKITKDLSTNL